MSELGTDEPSSQLSVHHMCGSILSKQNVLLLCAISRVYGLKRSTSLSDVAARGLGVPIGVDPLAVHPPRQYYEFRFR